MCSCGRLSELSWDSLKVKPTDDNGITTRTNVLMMCVTDTRRCTTEVKLSSATEGNFFFVTVSRSKKTQRVFHVRLESAF